MARVRNPGELARIRPQSAHLRDAAAPAWPAALVLTAAACAIAGGMVTLADWALEIPRLTDWKDDGISMFPNTAVYAVLSGAALLSNGSPGASLGSCPDERATSGRSSC